MNRWLEWLLGLENIRLGRDAPLLFKWSGALEAWMLFCFALVALALVFFVYRRERISRTRRVMLAVVRCVLLALVVTLLCGPTLVLQRNRVEPSHVALLVDRSLSMAQPDVYGDTTLARSMAAGAALSDPDALSQRPRLSLVQAALLNDDGRPLHQLLERNAVHLATFAGTMESRVFVNTHEDAAALKSALGEIQADGVATDLAGALEQVMHAAQGRRLAAVILASDGQSTQGTRLRDALEMAAGRQIPIYPLRIGSPEAPGDIEVIAVRAQETVFLRDLLAVEARIVVRGREEPTPVSVRLVDERSGTTAAERDIILAPDEMPVEVELRTTPTQTGRVRYRVEVDPLPSERSVANNAEWADVTVLDSRLRVLYVDGYPRYEYRYLKNAMLREQSMELSVLLLEADEQFVQEGTEPIRRFPETPEELHRFDAVIFGDVDPRGGWLSEAQMRMLLDFVGHEGGGFGLIAGERHAPYRFLDTPLERLIPVRIDPSFFGRYESTLSAGFRPQLTGEGRRSPLFRFALEREQSERVFDALPELFWFARTHGPRPGASVLLEHPTVRSAAGPMPLVVTGRYGAGKLLFQATDDTWRWRRHTGELLHDGYWVQVARELMPALRVGQSRRFVIRTDRRLYEYGQAVRAQVDFLDPELLAEQRDAIRMTLTASGDAATAGAETGGLVAEFEARRISPESSVFEVGFVPPRPGGFSLQAPQVVARPGEHSPSVLIRVEPPVMEMRRPEANHNALEQAARVTGGQVVSLDEIEEVFGTIRDRSVQIPDDVTEPLWDSKLVLCLFVLMITIEWVMRKAFGLL